MLVSQWYTITNQPVTAAAFPRPVTQSDAWSVSWLAAARTVDAGFSPSFEEAARRLPGGHDGRPDRHLPRQVRVPRGRLVTAIREGSPGVTPDPTWTPLFTTPLHPEYPSGHGGYTGAAQAILTAFFGPVAPASVSATSPTEDVSSLWGWLAATGVALFTSLAVPGPSSNGFRQLLLRTWPLSPAHVEESGQREA